MSTERSRGWCWTINNPTSSDADSIHSLQSKGCSYYVYGQETGETGTFHFQGFSYFPNKIAFSAIKGYLPRAHVERQRGTCTQAIIYCTKEGVVTEWGVKPDEHGRDANRIRWGRLIELAENGRFVDIKREFPSEYIRYRNSLRALHVRPSTILNGDLENEWWVGLSGTGKSTKLWREYPHHFGKDLNKWWCGYNDEEVVAIEEWSPKYEMLASKLKVWADRYPFNAEIKGGTLLKIRPKKVIVLSNYTIEQCFPNEEDWKPLKRRFKITYFPFQVNQDVSFVADIDFLESTLNLNEDDVI